MAQRLQDIVFGSAVMLGLTPSTSVVGSSDPNAPLLLRLANFEGRELSRRHDWQALKVDYTVPTLATEAQTALPADYDRFVPYVEMWNRTLGLKYCGPTDDVTWSRIKALGAVSAPGFWRLIGGVLQITPAPAAGQTLAFTYISQNWAKSNVGVPLVGFFVDTDLVRVPEWSAANGYGLVESGIIWRWKKAKGFDYAEDMATYERELERTASRDRGLAPIVVSKARPDNMNMSGTWPGVITP